MSFYLHCFVQGKLDTVAWFSSKKSSFFLKKGKELLLFILPLQPCFRERISYDGSIVDDTIDFACSVCCKEDEGVYCQTGDILNTVGSK
jgi:hypothetical protein